jgi:restriction system protein
LAIRFRLSLLAFVTPVKIAQAVPDAVEEYFGQVLALSEYPSGFPQEYQVASRQEPRELVIEYRLPPVELIPSARDFRYVKARREIDELARPVKETKEFYASVIHQVALRTMWECFAVTVAEDVVDTVVFNGIVAATNRATGQAEELHLISAPASRADFSRLVLDQLEPGACLKHLKAILSPHPYEGLGRL